MSLPTLTFGDGDGPSICLERLIESRMLIQANSGGGKSHLLRWLLESTFGKVQQLVLDPEGEFASLRERYDYLLAGGQGDIPLSVTSSRVTCRRLMECGASAVLDLYDLPPDQRRAYVAGFLDELMHLPRVLWHPTLVVIDEAHMYAPERGAGEASSTEAVITLCTQGRKRGFCAILATQRLAKLHKDAAAELLNKFIGRTGLDVDVARASTELGFDKAQKDGLKRLQRGSFWAYGPAITEEVTLVQIPETKTKAPGKLDFGKYVPPPAGEAIRALLPLLAGIGEEAAAEAGSLSEANQEIKRLRAELSGFRALSREPVVERVEVRVVPPGLQESLEAALAFCAEASKSTDLTSIERPEAIPLDGSPAATTVTARAAGLVLEKPEPIARPRAPKLKPDLIAVDGDVFAGLTRPQRAILTAIRRLESLMDTPPKRGQVAALAGTSPKSSGFEKNLSALRTAGLADYPSAGSVVLTRIAREAIPAQTPPSNAEMLNAWRSVVSGPQFGLLELAAKAYPGVIVRADAADQTGTTIRSSGFEKNLSALRSFGLIDYPDTATYRATALLFPGGAK